VVARGQQIALGGQGVAQQDVAGQQRLRVAGALRAVQDALGQRPRPSCSARMV
jgi:hypothetical protein